MVSSQERNYPKTSHSLYWDKPEAFGPRYRMRDRDDAKVLQPFGKVWGLDPDEHTLSYARNKMRGEVEIFQGSLPDDLPAQQRFGLVTAFDVIEHLEDDVHGMRAIFVVWTRFDRRT